MLSPRLQALFGADFADIEESHLEMLVSGGVTEAHDLDFKVKQYDYAGKGAFELAKDVSAFANEVGGLIVIGIGEDLGVAAMMEPIVLSDEVEARMRQVLAAKVFPMIDDVGIRRVKSNSKTEAVYLLIDVPASTGAPHGVLLNPDQNPLCWPVRNGTTTRFLREGELAARYRDRFELIRGQVDRLPVLHREGAAHPEIGGIRSLTLDLALAPERTLRSSVVRSLEALAAHLPAEHSAYGPLEIDRRQARFVPRRRRLRIEVGSSRLELHTDGSAWIRTFVGVPGYAPDQPLRLDVTDFERKLVAMLMIAAGTALSLGATGDCVVSALLGGPVSGPLLLLDGPGGRVLGEPRGARVSPAEITWRLADLVALPGAAAAAHSLASDLEQDLGLASPVFLTSP